MLLVRLAIVVHLTVPTAPSHAVEAGPTAGRDCREMARSTPQNEVWWTTFFGEREKAIGELNVLEWTREVRCFTSEAACHDWLEWARLHWPDLTRWRPCRRGVPGWLEGPRT